MTIFSFLISCEKLFDHFLKTYEYNDTKDKNMRDNNAITTNIFV